MATAELTFCDWSFEKGVLYDAVDDDGNRFQIRTGLPDSYNDGEGGFEIEFDGPFYADSGEQLSDEHSDQFMDLLNAQSQQWLNENAC